MRGKERIRAILNREATDRVGFWLGNPSPEARKIYCDHLGIECEDPSDLKSFDQEETELRASRSVEVDIELAFRLKSDLFWQSPEINPLAWNHPEGRPMFDVLAGRERESFGQPGILAGCEDPKEIEAFDWPNPDYLDFTSTIEAIDKASERGMAVFGGMWAPFFHIAGFFLGEENYYAMTQTHPAVVEALTERILDFYLEANRRCLEAMGSKIDAMFFGNDLGSQRSLLISPKSFERFVLPGYRKIVEQAHHYNLKVVLHSCGSISRIIPFLIDVGIEGLHPLQALAKGMDADSLANEFKDDLVFIGGVDTQKLLPFGTPDEVKQEVRRLKTVFGERYIVSPSHEAILPNVSLDNVIAMRDAALE